MRERFLIWALVPWLAAMKVFVALSFSSRDLLVGMLPVLWRRSSMLKSKEFHIQFPLLPSYLSSHIHLQPTRIENRILAFPAR